MVHHHLRKNGYTVQYVFCSDSIIFFVIATQFFPPPLLLNRRLQDEHPELHKEIKNILNGPENVVLVPAGVNRAVRLSIVIDM